MKRRHDDEGAALILVLLVISVVAVVLGALLSFADTSLRTTINLRDQAATSADADGAVQAAINNIRNSTSTAGGNCFGSSNTLSLPSFDGSTSAAVSCSADPATVLIQCPSLSNCNRPGNAILTLGRVAGEDGLNIQQNTNSTFQVHGNVFANSNVNVVNGALNTNARVWARGACAGTVLASTGVSCNYGNTANSLGNDPGYSSTPWTRFPAHQKVPTCSANNSLVTFQPGYYDDAYALTNLMDGSSCKNSVWWFTPGTYYFDFHNDPARNPNRYSGLNTNNSNGGDRWTIGNGYLVAGTPTDAAGTVLAKPPATPAIPGACDNPIKDAGAQGVQFVFGGDSQMQLAAGQVEICGTYSASKPPIAVYGVSTGAGESTTSLTGGNALAPSKVDATGGYGATATTANLSGADAAYASWQATKTNDSTTLTVSGFNAPVIPSGSILQSASLTVRHRNTSSTGTDTLSAVVTPAGQSAEPTVTGGTSSTAFHTDTLTLDASPGKPLYEAVYSGFTDATVALTTGLAKNNDAENIDAIGLQLTFVAPALRPASGCVTATPYTGTGSTACAQILTKNGSGNQFYVQGTTYEPAAAVNITLNNAAEQVFRFGVVARSLWVKETGSFSYAGPVIEVPDDSPGFTYAVYLTAYVCPGKPSCDTTGAPVLRTKVAIVDAVASAPVAGQRQIAILSWSPTG